MRPPGFLTLLCVSIRALTVFAAGGTDFVNPLIGTVHGGEIQPQQPEWP
jgi:hypothetical protein